MNTSPAKNQWHKWLLMAYFWMCLCGTALAAKTYTDNGDGTVTDPTTGLQWMRCSMGQTWNGTTCKGTPTTYNFDEANALTGTVALAGKSDWRVPNIRELQTIVVRAVGRPAIDKVAFPDTPQADFWSTSSNARNSANAWRVDFSYGSASSGSKLNGYRVRLARAGQSLGLLDLSRPNVDYVDHGDGTVTHIPTGLMWQRCSMGQSWTAETYACVGTASSMNWDAAKLLISNFASRTDWRLPTVDELLSLVDYSKYPSFNGTMFPNTPRSYTWSDLADGGAFRGAWYVNFDSGSTGSVFASVDHTVRLVRAGKSFGPFALDVRKTGVGEIASSVMPGIECGTLCIGSYEPGTIVTLNAAPAASFIHWGDACASAGSAPTCTLIMDMAKVVSANFSSGRLINISTRGQVSTGDGVMIGGFIISGTASKKVLIRAIGPNLANFGISGTLPDPKLELFEGPTLIGSNDNWQIQAIAADVAAITATGLAPANVAESALLVTLKPGVAYTAVVTGVDVPSGVGIVEVFEADHPEYQLINISTRGRVDTGEGVMIGGFIIQGDAPKTVLIRAVGPNLTNFGVSGVLTDPMMDIYRSSDGVKIASNDDWQTQTIAADVSAITATGLPPADPRESAILLTLPPGAYTAVVSGKGGGTGVGIVEVFAR